MSSLYFINCYEGSPIKDISYIDLEKGHVANMEIKERQLNSPYQMEMTLNVDFPFYDEILADSLQGIYGFRYRTNEQHLAFVIRDKTLLQNGQIQLKLRSSMDILTESTSYPDIVNGTLSVNTILTNLDTRFNYTLISANRNITLKSGIKNDLEVLQAICDYADEWSFRENKLIDLGNGNWKTEILIGNFGADLEAYYNADTTNRVECTPLYITRNYEIDNPKDSSQLVIDKLTKHYPSNFVNRLFVFGDNNQGISPNSRTNLDPRYITQRSDFPLLSVTKQGQTYWCIQNTKLPVYPIREKMIAHSSSNNEQDNAGVQLINQTVSVQTLYQYGISYYQAISYSSYISFSEGTIKKLTLPGNIVNLNWTQTYILPSGERKLFINEQGKKILNNLENINLNIIKN